MSVSTTSMPGGASSGDDTLSAGGPAPAVTGGRAAPAWVWSALLVVAAVWLAFCWTVLRVEPSDMSRWAGAAVLFGAVCEALRAVSGGRMWWLNAGMAALFAATGMVIMWDRDGSLTTPAALVGWYLLVRGAVDIVTAVVSRANDATWGLPAAAGVLEVALGFWASSSFARTAGALVLMVGALALARGIADLTTSLGLRSAMASTGTDRVSRTGQAGARGYVAGMADFAAATATGARPGRARHRATGTAVTSAAAARKSERPSTMADADAPVGAESAADLDSMLALAGVSGAAVGSTLQAGGMSGTGSPAANMSPVAGAGMPGGAAAPSDGAANTSGSGVGTPMSTSGVGAWNGTSNGVSAQAISLAAVGSSSTGNGGRPTDRTAMPSVMTMGDAAGVAGTGRTGGPASAVGTARSGALVTAEPARPATMVTAPDVVPGADAGATGDRRIPAGPPAGMSIKGAPANAAVQGTQADTVRISPAAAAGTSAGIAASGRDGAPETAGQGPDRVPGDGPERGAEQGADRSADQGAGRGPDRGPDRPLGRRRAI